MQALPEPWLRGSVPGVNTLITLITPILYTFQQTREDLAKHTTGLTTEQIWSRPYGFGSLGFHIRHIACSTDRLITYLEKKRFPKSR